MMTLDHPQHGAKLIKNEQLVLVKLLTLGLSMHQKKEKS